MVTALQASCPTCKLKVAVTDPGSDGGVATITCSACGKKFGLRFPKGDRQVAKPRSTVAASTVDDPLTNLGGVLPAQMSPSNTNWEDYRVRRKPLIAGKPLAIAMGATFAIIGIVAIGLMVSKNAGEIDMTAIGDSLLKGPADTVEKIHANWQRYDEERKKLTASISRQSDCAELMFPLERLEEKHLNLLIRGALLDRGTTSSSELKDLPSAPDMQPSEGKTFRAVEAHLTTEFRTAEKKVNQLSNAVLSYLHTASKPISQPGIEAEKSSLNKTVIKHSLCRALAEAHRGTDESETAVTIYELAEELKRLKAANEPSEVKVVSTLTAEYVYAEYSANQMMIALAARFTKDSQSEIAKALVAFDQAFGAKPGG